MLILTLRAPSWVLWLRLSTARATDPVLLYTPLLILAMRSKLKLWFSPMGALLPDMDVLRDHLLLHLGLRPLHHRLVLPLLVSTLSLF